MSWEADYWNDCMRENDMDVGETLDGIQGEWDDYCEDCEDWEHTVNVLKRQYRELKEEMAVMLDFIQQLCWRYESINPWEEEQGIDNHKVSIPYGCTLCIYLTPLSPKWGNWERGRELLPASLFLFVYLRGLNGD